MTIKNLYAKKYMYALIAYSKQIDFRDGYGIFSAPCDGVEEAKLRVYSPDGEHVRTYEFDTFSATMDSENQSDDEIDMLNNIITIIDSISGSYAMQAINCLKEIDEISGCMCEYEINVDNYSSRDFEEVHSDFVNDWAECTSTGTDETGRYMETWETHSGEIYKIINNDYYPLSDDIPGQLQMFVDMPKGYKPISETFKNLTQFKKFIQPGMFLHVLNHCRPECVGTLKKVTFKNTVDIRTAEINPENGEISGKEMYLDFGKAKNWIFENGIYTQISWDGFVIIQFEIVEESKPTENHLEESRKEESTPTETKGEFTMKENTNATVQATEETTEKRYTAEEIQKLTGFKPENVRISAHVWHHLDGTPYNVFRAAFVAGTSYKIPAKYTKSAAAEICFTVVSNNGKSLKVNIYEKYNGKISEQMGKTKKLCPGSHGIWKSYDPETNAFAWEQKRYPVEFIQVDCINIKTASRWACDCTLFVVDCIPLSREKFEAWRQNAGTSTTNPTQPGRKTAEELNFTPVFYPVSEELARQHKNMISFDEYKTGKVTAEYQEAVKHAYELAKNSNDPEKSLYLADCYAKRLARWYDDFNRNGAACPSIMICGGGNFPVRKKEKQNARFDTLRQQYNKIKHLLDKIEKPHGYGVEIRRDTITAEEFENILYFETIINESENRLQLIFDGKPEEEERNILKRNGFRWSPRFKAWQRQLTENAVSAVWQVVNAFDRLEDAENAEIQAETEEIKATVLENERTAETEPEQKQEEQSEEMPEESAQPETSPTDSPGVVTLETTPTQADKPTGTPTEPETGLTDWNGVTFEPIPGIPDPETVGADTAEAAAKLTEALEKLDRMRHKLDDAKYISTANSRYYAGFLSAVCCIFGEILYDAETGKHHLHPVSETAVQPEETAQAEAEENSVETVQTAETVTEPEHPETVRFEPGKIYSAIHITNSDYISAYRVISRTEKTIVLENSSGERLRKRPTITDGYINGKQCRCETVYPDGVYSMCLVLDATNTVNADTPKQAEQNYFRQQQERTKQAVSAARQRQIVQTTNGTKITMTAGAAT